MVYNVLIVGSGGHALNHWRNFINIHEGFQASGVVDINTELLEHADQLWGIEPDAVAPTIDAAIETGIKADVALIATPIRTHHALAVEALEYGLHVICEKNLAHTMQAGIEMTKAAIARPHLATVVGHQYPYWRHDNWAIKRAIAEGKIGQLSSINCQWDHGGNLQQPGLSSNGGWRRYLDHPYMEDWAIHTIDLFRSFTQKDFITVSADLWSPPWSNRHGLNNINIRGFMTSPEEYEDKDTPLSWTEKTTRAKHLWENGKAPSNWVHAQFNGNSDTMGRFHVGENWKIFGSKGSIELMSGGKDERLFRTRMFTHNYENILKLKTLSPKEIKEVQFEWEESDLKPYPFDLECPPGNQWKGDNTEDEWDSGAFILEEVKQCIESGGKIKPLRNFEDCLKTFTISMAAMESSKHGGKPIFLPDMWEIPRE